jgi:hypothetical protein
MSEWKIDSFVSVGPLRFDMQQGEPEQVLNETARPFQKGSSANVTEAFNKSGVHVYYDLSGRVELVEAFPPARPTYNGVELMRTAAADVEGDLSKLGLTARDDGEGGLWFDEQGFALYAPGGQSEGVSIFRRGYDSGA